MNRARTVLVVAFGEATLLAQALAPLQESERIVVVDNSSDPQVRAVCIAADAHYLDAGRNGGFAAGVNLGLDEIDTHGQASDVLLLNPDARISRLDLDALQATFTATDNADVAAVAPRLIGADGTPQQTMWPFPSPSAMWWEAFGLARAGHRRQFATGAVLLLRAEALVNVGRFDERYFLYAEETDWQLRAVQRGWRSMFVEQASAHHVGAATSSDPRQREVLFHAGQEIYIRRWFGPSGWASYRAAAIVGAALRAVALRGARRAQAWRRATLYLHGPRRAAAAKPAAKPLRVAHLVMTDNFAGTEQYVAQVATGQAALGYEVTVIGGDPARMASALPPTAHWLAAGKPAQLLRSLRAAGTQDVVHTHLTSADFYGVITRFVHGGRLVSTRHIAKTRGSGMAARLAARYLQRHLDAEICISEYVQRATIRPARVICNAVSSRESRPDPRSRTILIAQRINSEKATEIALAAWDRSGLVADGWTLIVCGDGADRARLEATSPAGVQWRGWVEDMHAVMLESAALLAPAPGEPFGLSVVEAMSVGLPVIAAAGGGHLETVGLCADAMLFPPGDVQACAEQLTRLAAMSSDERAGYGAALREVQRRHFGLDRHLSQLEGVYRAILDA